MKIRMSQVLFLVVLLAIATFFFLGCGGGSDSTTNNNYYGESPSPTPTPTQTVTVSMIFSVRNGYNDAEPISSKLYMDGNLIGTTDPSGDLSMNIAIGVHDFKVTPDDSTNWNEKVASSIEVKESQTIVFTIVPKLLTGTPMRFFISNRTTGEAINGAQIFIYVGGVLTKTGGTTANGISFIKDIPSGSVKIVIKKPGYGDYTVDGIVLAGTEVIPAQYKLIPQ